MSCDDGIPPMWAVEEAAKAERSRIYREVVEPLVTKLEKGGTKACIWCEEDPHFTGCPVATAREQMGKP